MIKIVAGITAVMLILNIFLFAMRKINTATFWIIILFGFAVVQYLKARRTK